VNTATSSRFPIPVIPVERVISAVKHRCRYRAHLLRLLIVEMAGRPEGVTTEEVQSEFWVLYDHEPKRILVSQQLALLLRDKLIERVSRGAYRALRHAPAAHVPIPSIFD
jgi:hypothetical protein